MLIISKHLSEFSNTSPPTGPFFGVCDSLQPTTLRRRRTFSPKHSKIERTPVLVDDDGSCFKSVSVSALDQCRINMLSLPQIGNQHRVHLHKGLGHLTVFIQQPTKQKTPKPFRFTSLAAKLQILPYQTSLLVLTSGGLVRLVLSQKGLDRFIQFVAPEVSKAQLFKIRKKLLGERTDVEPNKMMAIVGQ